MSLEDPGQSWRRQPCFRRTHRSPRGMRHVVPSGCHRSREPWHGASKSLGSQAGRERMVAQEVSCPLHTRDMRAEAGVCALGRDVWALPPALRSIPKPCTRLSQESGASSQVSSWQSHWPPSFKSVRFVLQMKGSSSSCWSSCSTCSPLPDKPVTGFALWLKHWLHKMGLRNVTHKVQGP